jgi:CHAT domain-containing protein/tetratricopeptide (TPR) repeat protein
MIANRSFRFSPLVLGLLAVSPLRAAVAEDAGCPFSTPGVVVEAVTPDFSGFHAGLKPGDRLFSWCRAAGGDGECVARGDFRTLFDWLDFQSEDLQYGGAVLAGARGAESLRWNLLPRSPGLKVAPLLHGSLADAYQAARDREQAGDFAAAGQELEQAAELASGNHCTYTELWLRDQAARLRSRAQQGSEVDAGYEVALAKAQALKADRVESHLHMGWWEALWLRGDLTRARQQLEKALILEEKDHSEGLFIVLVLIRLSATAQRQDNLEESDRLSRRAYDLARRAAPGSNAEAAAANNLAATTATRGDLAQAERYLARSLAILEKLKVSDRWMLTMLWNYGELHLDRGDLAGAEAIFLRAKRALENVQPDDQELATTLHFLGRIAVQRGDHDAAESLFRRELVLFEKLDPDGDPVQERLTGLGDLALLRHQGHRAEKLWRRALAISENLNPMGPKSALCLVGLAEAMSLQGRAPEAEQLLQRALTIQQAINPEAVGTGAIHLKLGILLLEQGDTRAAETHLRAAIRIHQTYRGLLAESYHALARLQARRGQPEEAAANYRAAVDALEAQRTRLGGAQESRWLYGSSLGDLYFEAAEHQIALARPQEAWRFIERGRGRGLQELLAQRDLRFAGELPAELYAERRRLDAEYDRVQAALGNWAPGQGTGKSEALQDRLRDLRLEQAEVQERIQRSSPRVGALENFTPLDLAAARSALDPGTVLLEYAVGPGRTWLFVVEPAGSAGPGLSVFRIAAGEKILHEEVESFRNLLRRPGSNRAALQARARRLYNLLVRPADRRITGARRILVSPNGPLHTLPFAALMHGGHYLVERKPIHSVLSATIYAELKRSRPAHPDLREERLSAFAPLYPRSASDAPASPDVREALRRGWTLKPLPSTRKEVESIAALYHHPQVYLGREATEERAKSLGPESRLVHFACHGLLDERFPLNSALALTLPQHPAEGQDNGLLQAWEIFESVRLDADLVTLSACDTALGREMGGEGLVGLTRAFQYAGARSVLASLWGVADYSTSHFMKSFYGYLRGGKPKDEALRAAQIDQIRKKGGSSHPFFWAAFELSGDWR